MADRITVAEPPSATRHLGLDLGGTNIKSVVLERDAEGWRTLDRTELPTLADEGPEAVIARLVSIARAAIARHPGVDSAGLGVPGPYDPRAGTVRDLTNFPGDWAGRQLARIVGDAVGTPTHLINDARAFGLAELRLGAGRGASSMVGITLGTGLGGVVAIDGRIHQGHDGSAGELGHQTIVPDGPRCNCGNRGCLEAFVRADRIAAMCKVPSADEAVARARSGDAEATAGIAEIGRYLGIGLANVITVVTPDKVVIGGGGSAAFDLLIGPIERELVRRVRMTSLDQVRIVPAELGVWAGAIGAAIHGAEAGRSPLA